jgi:ABC-2 type transport system permease protein
MWSIYRKEINAFFSSLIGYLVIAAFLVLLGLFMFVFPDTSLLEYGFATMEQLFSLAPSLFVLIIPAITMRSFAEEQQTGAIELLVTRPISDLSIILGKFLASLSLVFIALLPTVLYYYTVYELGNPRGNLDTGGILGSYAGLLMLAAAFVAIGVFVSSLTANQIIAFLLAAFLCFWMYWGFQYMSQLPIFVGRTDDLVQQLGMLHHYNSLSRGVIDSRDMVYFLSIIALFVFFTLLSLERRKW